MSCRCSVKREMGLCTWLSDACTYNSARVPLPEGAQSRFVPVDMAFNARTRLLDYYAAIMENPIIYLYFGMLTFFSTTPLVTIQFMLKDEFDMTPGFLVVWSRCIGIPWGFKIVYAYISDNFTFFGNMRRVPMAMAGTLVGGLMWLCLAVQLALGSTSVPLLTVIMIMLSFSVAVGECGVNGALMDYVARKRKQHLTRGDSEDDANGVADCIFSLQGVVAGIGLVCGLTMGLLASIHLSSVQTALVTGAGFVANGIMCFWMQDPPWVRTRARKPPVSTLLRVPYMKRLLMFFSATALPPTSGTAMFYFMTERLHFGPAILSVVSIITAAAGSVGNFVYYTFLRGVNFHVLFTGVFLACAPLGFAQIFLVNGLTQRIGIPNKLFLVGDDAIQAAVGRIVRTPINSIMSAICPPSMRATSFELINSVANICDVVSGMASAALMNWFGITRTDFDNLIVMIVATNIINLAMPLIFVWFLPPSLKAITKAQRESKVFRRLHSRNKETGYGQSQDIDSKPSPPSGKQHADPLIIPVRLLVLGIGLALNRRDGETRTTTTTRRDQHRRHAKLREMSDPPFNPERSVHGGARGDREWGSVLDSREDGTAAGYERRRYAVASVGHLQTPGLRQPIEAHGLLRARQRWENISRVEGVPPNKILQLFIDRIRAQTDSVRAHKLAISDLPWYRFPPFCMEPLDGTSESLYAQCVRLQIPQFGGTARPAEGEKSRDANTGGDCGTAETFGAEYGRTKGSDSVKASKRSPGSRVSTSSLEMRR